MCIRDRSVREFLARPPCVERHDNGSRYHGAPEGTNPLGKVSRRDRHTIAFAYAEGEKSLGDGSGDPVMLLEGDALIFVDEEVTLTVSEREVEDLAQIGGGVLPNPQLDAVDRCQFGLEHLTRSRHLRSSVADRKWCFSHDERRYPLVTLGEKSVWR